MGLDEAAAFKRFEADGWTERAGTYGSLIARATALVADELLDAAGVDAGMRVLDVACGPGHISAAMAERGALPLGIDISAGMLAAARAPTRRSSSPRVTPRRCRRTPGPSTPSWAASC